jgi:hypothetical protein
MPTQKHTTDTRIQAFGNSPIQKYLLLTILLFSFLIISSRLATLLHEGIGHWLVGILFDGDCRGIYVSTWGGGYADCDLEKTSGIIPHLLYGFGGIIVNLLCGVALIAIYERIKDKTSLALFVVFFGLISILGAYSYLVIGIYYDLGDPSGWLTTGSVLNTFTILILLCIAPIISYYVFQKYLIIQQRIFPAHKTSKRLIIFFGTLGLSICIYFLVFIATSEKLLITDAPRIYVEESKDEIRQTKLEALRQSVLEKNPNISADELERYLKGVDIVVSPEEVPRKFPIIPILSTAYLLGLFMSSYRLRVQADRFGETALSKKMVLVNISIAIFILCILYKVNS